MEYDNRVGSGRCSGCRRTSSGWRPRIREFEGTYPLPESQLDRSCFASLWTTLTAPSKAESGRLWRMLTPSNQGGERRDAGSCAAETFA